jgi:hypothetical protein
VGATPLRYSQFKIVMLLGERQFVHLNECCIALRCLVKFHLVTNKRYVDGVDSGQDIFYY